MTRFKKETVFLVRNASGFIIGGGETPENAIYEAAKEQLLTGCELLEVLLDKAYFDGELRTIKEFVQRIHKIKVTLEISSIIYTYGDSEVEI